MISSSLGDVKTGHRRQRKKTTKKTPGGGTYHPAGAQILIRLRATLPRRGNARSVGHEHNRSAQVGSVHLRVNFLKAF